jgi:Asp-tRNA(Asn)/Glu-tRNA(Gln) amidotransferase A subunit family amidase
LSLHASRASTRVKAKSVPGSTSIPIRQWNKRAPADRSRPAGRLHGVPIGVKDIIDTVDMPTTLGSDDLRGAPARSGTPPALRHRAPPAPLFSARR